MSLKKNITIIIASDHAGYKLKEIIKFFLTKKVKNIIDLGTKSTNSVDYPDYAHILSRKMKRNPNYFKGDSVAHFDSALIEYVIVLFMFLAGTNFTLLYLGFKGKIKPLKNNDEFKWYLIITILLILVLTPIVYYSGYTKSLSQSLRLVSFQIVSILTTTGFASADFTLWGPFVSLIFFLLLFI